MSYYLTTLPKIVRPLAKDFIWSLPSETPSIFLTFDDGPIPEVTPKVCEILKQFNAKATFFCVGENVKKYPLELKKLIDEDHSVGNHTFNHLNGWKVDNKSYFKNIIQAKEYIDSSLFRPPYGKITRSQSKVIKEKYSIVMWDVLSGDFDSKVTWEKCVKNVVSNAKQGSIVVFHDSLKAADTMLKALPIILQHFADLNYTFKAIPMQNPIDR